MATGLNFFSNNTFHWTFADKDVIHVNFDPEGEISKVELCATDPNDVHVPKCIFNASNHSVSMIPLTKGTTTSFSFLLPTGTDSVEAKVTAIFTRIDSSTEVDMGTWEVSGF